MQTILLILKFLPALLAAIKGVEEVIGAGKGSTKKQLVLDSITAVAKVGEKVDDSHVAIISAMIDSNVKTLNADGEFKKTEDK